MVEIFRSVYRNNIAALIEKLRWNVADNQAIGKQTMTGLGTPQ